MQYPLTYIRLLLRMLKLDGQQQKQLLAGTALLPEQLDQLDVMVKKDDVTRILNNLSKLTDEPYLGLVMGDRLSLASHGPLGQLLSSSATLSDAWLMIEKYYALRIPFVNIHCRVSANEFVFDIQVADIINEAWSRQILLETVIINVQRSLELIAGRRVKEAKIDMECESPADSSKVAEYLFGQLNYGSTSNCIRVPLALMHMANPYHDRLLWQQAVQVCRQLYDSQHQQEPSLAQSIRQLLQQQMGRLWSLEEVSKLFNMSSRTLIRKLKAEGTRYQSLVDEELEKQAKTYLLSSAHTIESVAYALGYQDVSAFRRAFRRWCSMAPSEWQLQNSLSK